MQDNRRKKQYPFQDNYTPHAACWICYFCTASFLKCRGGIQYIQCAEDLDSTQTEYNGGGGGPD